MHTQAFAKLAFTPESKGLVSIFFGQTVARIQCLVNSLTFAGVQEEPIRQASQGCQDDRCARSVRLCPCLTALIAFRRWPDGCRYCPSERCQGLPGAAQGNAAHHIPYLCPTNLAGCQLSLPWTRTRADLQEPADRCQEEEDLQVPSPCVLYLLADLIRSSDANKTMSRVVGLTDSDNWQAVCAPCC